MFKKILIFVILKIVELTGLGLLFYGIHLLMEIEVVSTILAFISVGLLLIGLIAANIGWT